MTPEMIQVAAIAVVSVAGFAAASALLVTTVRWWKNHQPIGTFYRWVRTKRARRSYKSETTTKMLRRAPLLWLAAAVVMLAASYWQHAAPADPLYGEIFGEEAIGVLEAAYRACFAFAFISLVDNILWPRLNHVQMIWNEGGYWTDVPVAVRATALGCWFGIQAVLLLGFMMR